MMKKTHKTRAAARAICSSCSMEALEPRTFLSGNHPLGFSPPLAWGLLKDHDHGAPAATPIGDLTGTGTTVNTVTGVLFFGDVATITSSDTPVNLKGYSVSIDWGDGTKASQGFLFVRDDGSIHAQGYHVYSATGTFDITVTISQKLLPPLQKKFGAPAPLVVDSTAHVTQNSIDGVTIHPVIFTPFTGDVGTFKLPSGDTNTDVSSLSASINWGDHTRSAGTITLNTDGSYTVSGTHTYTSTGTFRVTVTVMQTPVVSTTTALRSHDDDDDHDDHEHDGDREANCSSQTTIISRIESTAIVGPVVGTGVTIHPVVNTSFTGDLGTFTLPSGDTNTAVSSFSVSIDWGDNSTSTGTIVLNDDGTYTVGGTHTYAAVGTFTVNVSVKQTPVTTTSSKCGDGTVPPAALVATIQTSAIVGPAVTV